MTRRRAPHGRQRVAGRNTHEAHRVATPLELLYDLTFAVAFGQAGSAFAHEVAQGSIGPAIGGGAIAGFAIVWAWTNFSWYASAFGPDDWPHRVWTMVQMVGVVVMALGFASFFHSLHDPVPDNAMMVAGYVVMRVAMVGQWVRVAAHDPAYRPMANRYAGLVGVVQVGWVVLAVAHTSWRVFVVSALVLVLVELVPPLWLDRRYGPPWHAHHIAERYSLLAILTLGEGVIGTVAALSSAVEEHGGWSVEAVLVAVAGIVLTFGLWWCYFTVDFASLLHLRRRGVPGFVGFHFLILCGLAATGAGLHVAGYVLSGEAVVDPPTAIAAIAWPVGMFFAGLYGLYTYFVPEADLRHLALVAITAVLLLGSVLLARAGVSPGWCLVPLMAAPWWPTVLGYETFGHDRQRSQLERLATR